MSVPLRKDKLEDNLTTADLAQGKRPVASQDLHKPVLTQNPTAERAENTGSVQRSAPENQTSMDTTPLFPTNELEGLRNRWSAVQTAFVDEPRRAVEQADGLVASAMKRLAEVFAEERSKLEQQWDRGDNVSTEDLRIALQRYRSFFHRLLSI
ncbi:MAG: hypothetical protein DMG80_08975 [Acidobacteria bacterium]|nr:MAG: hypothetical protein DMG80_08975 [Acidobacteriota bacterium]